MGDVLRPDEGIVLPIRVKRGEGWSKILYVNTPDVWTGYSGVAQVRADEDEASTLIAALATDFSVAKQVTLRLSSAATEPLAAGTRAVWDFYLVVGVERQYLVKTSPVEVVGRVSRP